MSLPHAILTALLERPSSGQDLARRFDRSIGYFWSATHQQIYRELARLESAGLIRVLPTDRPSQGQRREYEVLPAGRAELIDWLARAEDPRPIRDPLILRLRAAAAAEQGAGPALRAELRRHLDLHRTQLTEYLRIEQRDFPGDHDGPAGPAEPTGPAEPAAAVRLRHLVLRAGIDLETVWVDWLTRAVDELSAGAPEEPSAEAWEPGAAPGHDSTPGTPGS